MSSIIVPQYSQAVTSIDANNRAVVGDSSGFYPGCEAYLNSTTTKFARCIIVDTPTATTVGLRIIPDDTVRTPSLGRSDLTTAGWTTGTLTMPAQTARVNLSNTKVATSAS